MAEIKNGLGPDHIVREGNTVIKNGIGPDHIVESIECPEPDYTGWFQYPPDLTGVNGHVILTNKLITWDDLPTQEADNGSLRLISDHPLYKVYEFDADWENTSSNRMNWLTDVFQFRNNQISSGSYAFASMIATELTALPSLDTSNLTDMRGMFSGATKFNQSLSTFNTSNVTDMSAMFGSTSVFNGSLDNWDTSNVTSMSGMFWGTSNFNQTLNHFNTSNVTDMSAMFNMAGYNQPLNNWNTSNVTNMDQLFYLCAFFDQDISMWCVYRIRSKPTSFDYGAGLQNQPAKQPKWGQPC